MRHHRPGGPEVLQLDEVAPPHPGQDELLVEVAAAGISLPSALGLATARGPWPVAPGGEVAGRVVALGPGVEGWDVGQRVVSVAFTGALADLAVVPTMVTAAIPDTISDARAVALLRNGQVALGALRAGELKTGDSVLITAAAGGVGHLAVQLARLLGAGRVVAAVGSPGKDAFLRELGADAIVGYGEGDPAWDEPVQLVLDGAGRLALERGVAALAPFGRLVSYSAVGGNVAVNELRARSCTITGFAVAHLARYRPRRYVEHRHQLWRLALDGTLRPAVHLQFPLTEAQRAHRFLLDRENLGKIILVTHEA